jgi:hypothetical protein
MVVKQPAPRRESFPSQLEFFEVAQHHVLASFRNVAIAVWVDETSVGAVRRAQDLLERLSTEWPQGIALLQVFGEDNQRVEPTARIALKELLLSGRRTVRQAPVVYEGSGFRAAAIRGMVTGLLSHRDYGFPHRVYSRIEDAALAVVKTFEKREPTRHARDLCEALARVRERHERAFPTASHSFIRYKG